MLDDDADDSEPPPPPAPSLPLPAPSFSSPAPATGPVLGLAHHDSSEPTANAAGVDVAVSESFSMTAAAVAPLEDAVGAPSYHTNSVIGPSPSYHRNARPSEQVLAQGSAHHRPGSRFQKASKLVSVSLGGQEPNTTMPSYGRAAVVDGVVTIAPEALDNVLKLDVSIEGEMKLVIAEGGSITHPLLAHSIPLFFSSSPNRCPATHPFSFRLPPRFQDGDTSRPLPPTYEVNFTGVPGVRAVVRYWITIRLVRQKIWKRKENLVVPFVYFPRARPPQPIIGMSFISSLKSNPEEWSLFSSDVLPRFPGGVDSVITCSFVLPSTNIFPMSRKIPFHLQLSLSPLAPSKSSKPVNGSSSSRTNGQTEKQQHSASTSASASVSATAPPPPSSPSTLRTTSASTVTPASTSRVPPSSNNPSLAAVPHTNGTIPPAAPSPNPQSPPRVKSRLPFLRTRSSAKSAVTVKSSDGAERRRSPSTNPASPTTTTSSASANMNVPRISVSPPPVAPSSSSSRPPLSTFPSSSAALPPSRTPSAQYQAPSSPSPSRPPPLSQSQSQTSSPPPSSSSRKPKLGPKFPSLKPRGAHGQQVPDSTHHPLHSSLLTPLLTSGATIRVTLQRQISVDVRSQKVLKTIVCGEGLIRRVDLGKDGNGSGSGSTSRERREGEGEGNADGNGEEPDNEAGGFGVIREEDESDLDDHDHDPSTSANGNGTRHHVPNYGASLSPEEAEAVSGSSSGASTPPRGRSRARSNPSDSHRRGGAGQPQNAGEGELDLDDYWAGWEGEVVPSLKQISVGGFRAAGLAVRDFIILTLIPPDPETSPLRTHQHAVPVRIVTDAWEEEAEDQ